MRFPVLADTIKVTSKIGKSGMVLPPVVLRCGGRGSGHSQRHSESEASLSQTTKNSERSGYDSSDQTSAARSVPLQRTLEPSLGTVSSIHKLHSHVQAGNVNESLSQAG